jgi:hypothetical protein
MPSNALVLSEFVLGEPSAPRWVELTNPGKYAIALDQVALNVSDPKAGGPQSTWAVGKVLGELPAGESIAIGHVPPNASGWLKLKVLDLGPSFALPPCHGKVVLYGPGGQVDAISYSLCAGGGAPPAALAWALDPGYLDACKNDELTTWCPTTPGANAIGTPGKSNPPCDLDGDGYSSGDADCDDQKPAVFPGAFEICNGTDDNCDGQVDDGVVAPAGTCLAAGVCANASAACKGAAGWSCAYPPGFESSSETLCDGADNDCDGQTDEGLLNACGSCGSAVPAEVCNGKDDDCNGTTDDLVPDNLPPAVCMAPGQAEVQGVCAGGVRLCTAGIETCQWPAEFQPEESWCDGLDNDCDGETDELLGLHAACVVGTGRCAASGKLECGGGKQLACIGTGLEPIAEVCGNGQDDNCDGQTDEGFGVGEQCAAGLGVCRVLGKRKCTTDRKAAVCSVSAQAPAGEERCGNLLDDDCDGQTDETGCTLVSGGGSGCRAGVGGSGLWLVALVLVPVLLRRRAIGA